jgi:hypothetical protein
MVFARDGQKVQLTLDGVLAVNEHDANVVAGLMNIGIVKGEPRAARLHTVQIPENRVAVRPPTHTPRLSRWI